MKTYTAAVIGAGFIGAAHVEALRRLGNVKVVALCDTFGAREKADRMNIELAYSDYEKMMDEVRPDAIHICTPNSTHYAIAKSAIGRGIHFVCEKPFTTTVEQAKELVKLAEEKGVTGAVNFHNRLYPITNEMRQIVAAGELGELFSAHGEYIQDWLLYETDYSWRLDSSQTGKTRAMADIGSHWIDLMEFVTGEKIRRVSATFRTVYPVRKKPLAKVETFQTAKDTEYEPIPIDTEDEAALIFELTNGAIGNAIISMVYAGRKNTMTLHLAGSREALSWSSEDLNNLWIGHRERPNEQLTKDAALMHPASARLAGYPSGHIEGFPDAFKNVFREFYDSLDHPGDYSFARLTDGLRQMQLLDCLYQSATTHQWVEIPE